MGLCALGQYEVYSFTSVGFHQEKLGFDKEKKVGLKERALTANIAGSS